MTAKNVFERYYNLPIQRKEKKSNIMAANAQKSLRKWEKLTYFSDKYTTEWHLRILGIRYEWTPYLKPLATYFQNIHLRWKNNRLLEYKPFADIYWRHKGYRKETMWE